jgi:enoyl-CoA hydratase/carnithine racemase
MSPLVEYEAVEGVATITLNRPDRLNAWTPALGREYLDLVERAGAEPEVRAAVVTGAGRGFCAGADMDDLADIGPGRPPAFVDTRPQTLSRTIHKPFIAAINGACAGVGMMIAMSCDLRFSAPGVKFTTAFARRGLIAEYGLSWLLTQTVGYANAMDLLLSARVVLADEALSLGLVDRVVSPEDGGALGGATEFARELATFSSPTSMGVIKRQLVADLERGLSDSYAESVELMMESLEGPDLSEGVASFVERRAPRFPPLDLDRVQG